MHACSQQHVCSLAVMQPVEHSLWRGERWPGHLWARLQLGNNQAKALHCDVFSGCLMGCSACLGLGLWLLFPVFLFKKNQDNGSPIFFFRAMVVQSLQAQGVNASFRCSHKLWSASLNCRLPLFGCHTIHRNRSPHSCPQDPLGWCCATQALRKAEGSQ